MAKVQMALQPVDSLQHSSLNIFSCDEFESIQSWTGLIATNIVCQHRVPLNAEIIGHLIFYQCTYTNDDKYTVGARIRRWYSMFATVEV